MARDPSDSPSPTSALPPVPKPGETPFNFISEGPARKNWEEAGRGVLSREFKKKRREIKKDFATFAEAQNHFQAHLKTLSTAEAEAFADRMRDRQRKAFYRQEAKNPSFAYSPEQHKKLKKGSAPTKTLQLEHLEEVKTKVRGGKTITGHPERALDPGNVYFTTGGKGGTAPKGTLHAEKHRTSDAARDMSRRVRAKAQDTGLPASVRARIRRSQRGFATVEAAGSIATVAMMLLGAWIESQVDGYRISSAVESSLPAALNAALDADTTLPSLVRRLPGRPDASGKGIVTVHALVQVEYSSSMSVVWDDVIETPTSVDSVSVTGFSAIPQDPADRLVSSDQESFNLFVDRSRMTFSVPLDVELGPEEVARRIELQKRQEAKEKFELESKREALSWEGNLAFHVNLALEDANQAAAVEGNDEERTALKTRLWALIGEIERRQSLSLMPAEERYFLGYQKGLLLNAYTRLQ